MSLREDRIAISTVVMQDEPQSSEQLFGHKDVSATTDFGYLGDIVSDFNDIG